MHNNNNIKWNIQLNKAALQDSKKDRKQNQQGRKRVPLTRIKVDD